MMITAPPFFTIETERHQIIQTVLRPTSNNLMETQLDELQQQYCHFLKANELTEEDLFFAKAFVSDFLNQKEGIHSHPLFVKYFNNCGLSIVEQPPLDGNKVNIMLLFVKGAAIRKERKGDVFYAETSDHLHLFQSIPCFSPVDFASFNPETGEVGKPFLLPQKDPAFYDTFTYTYNVPELITSPVTNSDELISAIENTAIRASR